MILLYSYQYLGIDFDSQFLVLITTYRLYQELALRFESSLPVTLLTCILFLSTYLVLKVSFNIDNILYSSNGSVTFCGRIWTSKVERVDYGNDSKRWQARWSGLVAMQIFGNGKLQKLQQS